jgi:hypothetical protein
LPEALGRGAEKPLFLRSAFPPQRAIAVRKAAEPRDDPEMMLGGCE